jgi:hypothetical protein
MSTANNVQCSYTGKLRFQERGNRRYLQQQVKETTLSCSGVTTFAGNVVTSHDRYFFEDIPMVDENEQPLEKGPRG